jgi:hypothetical protein
MMSVEDAVAAEAAHRRRVVPERQAATPAREAVSAILLCSATCTDLPRRHTRQLSALVPVCETQQHVGQRCRLRKER